MEVISDLDGSNLFGVVEITVKLNLGETKKKKNKNKNLQKMMYHEKRDRNEDSFFKNFCQEKGQRNGAMFAKRWGIKEVILMYMVAVHFNAVVIPFYEPSVSFICPFQIIGHFDCF